MLLVRTVDEFLASPDRLLVGDRYAAFSPDPSLYGFVLWGQVDEAALRAMFGVLDEQLERPGREHVGIGDLRRVEWIDTSAFDLVTDYFRRRGPELARRVRKQAALLPPGLNALLVAGFLAVDPLPYPVRVCADVDEAARFVDDPRVPALLAEVAAAIDARGPVRAAVQRFLGGAPRDKDLAGAARALAMSPRTLQRRLRDEGSTFQAELDAARLAAAQILLATTDDKLTSIALEVGCASLQHFSSLFRKLTGETPSAWRARHRR